MNLPIRRRGIISIWAIICLILVAALAASLGRLALTGSRQMIQERRRAQADWLVQSGWSLAVSQLRQNPDYKGEKWEVSAADLGGADPGRVLIEVTPPTEAAMGKRQINVIAEFPVDSDRRVQITRQGMWGIE